MMKRTKTFVLLCAFVLALCSVACAEEVASGSKSVEEYKKMSDNAEVAIPAPLVDHGQNGQNNNSEDPNTNKDPSDYALKVTGSGTEEAPYVLALTATDLEAHYNGEHTLGYWIGVGVKKDTGTSTKYYAGWGTPSASGDGSDKLDNEIGDYVTCYFPLSYSPARNGYIVVSNDNSKTYYSLDFSNVTLKDNDFVNLKTATTTINATSGITTVDFEAETPHKGNITLAGKLLPNSEEKYVVSVDISAVSDTTMSCDYKVGELTLEAGNIARTADVYKDFTGNTFSFDISDTSSTKGYIAIRYVSASGAKNSADKIKRQYVLYTLDFSGITKMAASSVTTAPAPKSNLTYTDSAQALVEEGTAEGGELQYAVTTTNTAPTEDSEYTATIPTRTNVGTYYVWYKVEGDDTHTDFVATEAIEVKIDKGTPEVTAPIPVANLSHSDSAQKLITAGSATLGATLSYVVTTEKTAPDDSKYATTIPEKTDAGTYYVWYKVIGTDNYNGTEAQSVTVTISGAPVKPALTLSLTPKSGKDNLANGTVGEAYSDNLTEYFDVTTNGSLTWSATGLPAGLSASTAGAISGTPTASADKKAVTVTVKATSADTEPTSSDKTATLYITINAKAVVPVDPASGDVTSGDVKSQDVKPDEPVKSDDVNPVVPTTSDDEAVKEIENILSGDATLGKEDVEKVISNLESLSNDVALNSTEADNLVKNILSQDSALSLSDQQVEAVAKALVSNDGTITAEAMTTLTNSLAKSDTTTGETTLTAEALTGNSTAAKIAVQALASSVENSENKELNLETVPLTSLSGISDLLDKVVAGSSSTTSTSELTLDLGKVETLKTVDNLSGVSVKEIKLENNTSVTDVKLDGASIDKVSMKSSAVKEVKLDSTSNVKEIDASGADLTSIDLASNDKIVTLNISETKVSELNAAGCAGLKDLSAEATSEGAGELREVNLEGCTSLEKLSLSNNQLLGVKKPSGFTTPSGFTFKARGQRRTSSTKFSSGMNFFEFIFNLWKATLSTEDATDKTYETASADAPVNFSDIVSVKADGNNVSFDADGKLSAGSAAPTTSFSYELDPFGLTKTSTEGSSVKAAAEDDGMEVTISGEGEESNGTSGSGGGCDTGLFGFSVLSALAVFITRRQRR